MSDQPPPRPARDDLAGLSAEQLKALADKRDRAVDSMTGAVDKADRARQAVIDKMR